MDHEEGIPLRSLVARIYMILCVLAISFEAIVSPTIENGQDLTDPPRTRDRLSTRRNRRDLYLFRLNRARGLLRRAGVGYHHTSNLRRNPHLRSLQALRKCEKRLGSILRGKGSAIAREAPNKRDARFFVGPRRGLSAITAKRGLIRASPLFLLTLALTLLVPHVYAPFGDGQLGFAVAQSSQGGALHFGGNTATAGNIANLQAVFMNNTLGDGFVSGVVTYVGDSTFFCGNDATFLATFVPGYNPSLTGQSGIAPGNVYTITQAISNAPCNSGSAGGLSGSEYTVPQQTFVRLGQWVGWVIYSNSATISAVDGGGLQCKTGSQTGPTYFDV